MVFDVINTGVGSTFAASVSIGDRTVANFIDSNETATASESASLQESEPIKLDCHVLVVDDRRDIRSLSKHIITKAGATVDECEDGKLAVDRIATCLADGMRPDLILLDMQMTN